MDSIRKYFPQDRLIYCHLNQLTPFYFWQSKYCGDLDIFDATRLESESEESGWFSNSNLTEATIADVKGKIANSKSRYDELLHSMDAVKTQIALLNEFS